MSTRAAGSGQVPPPPVPGVGETIDGKYRIERELGEGGMGKVVAALHEELGRRVALKFLLPQHAENPEIVARFVREGRALSQLQSEHVGKVFDVARTSTGMPYLVMELLDGEDLSRRISAGGPLDVPTAADYVLQALEAVAEAHSLGIIHRDLKPANLFVNRTRDGRRMIKVLDFGIAKITGDKSQVSLTKTSAAIGSAAYMSPEQLRSSPVIDHRTDIWAIGVILFEVLTGEMPFEGEEVASLSVRIVLEPPRSLRELRADVPPALEAVVLRCLEKVPDARYDDVAELAAALAPFAPQTGAARLETIQTLLGMTLQAQNAALPVAALPPVPTAEPSKPTIATAPTMVAESATDRSIATKRSVPVVLVVAMGIVALAGTSTAIYFGTRGPSSESSKIQVETTPREKEAETIEKTKPAASSETTVEPSALAPSIASGTASVKPPTGKPTTKPTATTSAKPSATKKPPGGFNPNDY